MNKDEAISDIEHLFQSDLKYYNRVINSNTLEIYIAEDIYALGNDYYSIQPDHIYFNILELTNKEKVTYREIWKEFVRQGNYDIILLTLIKIEKDLIKEIKDEKERVNKIISLGNELIIYILKEIHFHMQENNLNYHDVNEISSTLKNININQIADKFFDSFEMEGWSENAN